MKFFGLVAAAALFFTGCSNVRVDKTQDSMGNSQVTLTCKNPVDCDAEAAKICGNKRVDMNYIKDFVAKAKNANADTVVDVRCR